MESRGYEVQEVSAYDVGCDLWAIRADDEKVWVEVKGRSGQFPISLTDKQWERAREKREKYWLLVVEVDKENLAVTRSLYRIVDPARYPFEQRETKSIEYEAGAEDWLE